MLAFAFQHILKLIHKGRYVLELTINRGKANVGDLINLFELVHHKLAYIARRNLAFH